MYLIKNLKNKNIFNKMSSAKFNIIKINFILDSTIYMLL